MIKYINMQQKKCGNEKADKQRMAFWNALAFALVFMNLAKTQNLDIKDSILYPGLKQDAREMRTYRYLVGPTKPSMQVAITIEPDDATSDPDIFISKQNQINNTDYQYDMQCSKAGSDICILKKGYVLGSDTIYINVRCMNACQFSLKVSQVSITSLGTNLAQISRLQIDSRAVSAFSYQIPTFALDGTPVDYVLFTVDPLLTSTPISLYLSTSDDLAMIDEKEVDNIVETSGQSLRFSSTDQGWCVGCTVYLILNNKAGGTFAITAKPQSKRDLLQDQLPISKTFSAFKGQECLTYPVIASSNNDAVITIRTQQGDLSISIVNRNATLEQSVAFTDVIPIQSASGVDSPLKQLIIRNVYRQKVLNVLPTMSICFNAYKTSTALIQAVQRKYANKFDLIEDTMTTFTLDSKDFIYFRFTSLSLALPNQTITITMQANNLASALLTPPKLAYRVCQSAVESECTLTDTLAFTGVAPMSAITGVVDTLTSVRTAIINHMPSQCVDPYSCHYLISVYNPDTTGLMRVSVKASLSYQNVQPIRLFQEYIGQVEMNQYQYFQVAFIPQQISFLKIATIRVKLTTYNGQTELYASNKIRNPQYNISEFSSTSSNSINLLVFNVSQVKDLSNYTLYIGVFGQASMATYQLKIDADYVTNQTTPVQPDTPIRQQIPPPWIRGTLIQDKTPVVFTLDTGNTTSKVNFTYQVPQGMLTNKSSKTTFVVCKIFKTFSPEVSFFYNVSLRNSSVNQQGLNTSFTVPIDSTYYDYDNLDYNIVYVMFEIRLRNITGVDLSKQKITLQLAAFTVDNSLQASYVNPVALMSNQTYLGYLRGGKYAVFRAPLMDSNSTHRFVLNNIIGPLTLKIKHANGSFDYSKMAQSANDTFYDYASTDPDWQDQQLIGVTQKMRESVNAQCRNASSFLNGGNSNCTIYTMVKCEDLVCLFNLTDIVYSPFNGRGGVDSPPILLLDSTFLDLTVDKNGSTNFYIPYISQQISGDRAIHLNKSNGVDCYIVGRIITNAYLPYQQWKYPTNISYDFISKSSTNNELIDLPRANLTSKCPNNTSCAVLISIVGNAPQGSTGKNATSSFRLTYLTETNILPSNSVVQSTLVPQSVVDYDYYWFTINTKPKGVSYKWVQNLILRRDNSGPKIDMLISLFDGRLPTSEDYDYKSTMVSTDFLQISSDDAAFTKFNQQSGISRLLVIVGVKRNFTFIKNTAYTLMNWGPVPQSDAPVNFTDLALGKATSFVFQPRTSLTDKSQYKVLRFFSYGMRDLQFNITCTDGQVLVLAGSQRFKNPGDQNIFLNIPLFAETSDLTPTVLSKNQTLLLKMANNNAQTSGFFCTFCWYYITIISNSSNLAAKSAAIVNATELKDIQPQTSTLAPGYMYQNISMFSGQIFQFAFSIPSKNPFLLNMTFTQGFNFSATIGLYSDYQNNPVIWSASSVTGNLVLQAKQNDNRFDIGNQYYVTLINNYKIQGTKVPVNITLSQNNDILFLKQGRTVDRMWNNNDYVKYYYLMAPAVFVNYTASITIQSKTPGMYPIIQALRNDIIGSTIPLTSMKYPSFNQYTQSYEKPFYQAFNQTTAITLSLTNKIINQPVSQIVNGVVKNTTISLTNQTFFTIALYWVNQGYTDFQKAEYEIFVKLTPVTGKLMSSPSNDDFKSTLKQHVIMQRIFKRTQEDTVQGNNDSLIIQS